MVYDRIIIPCVQVDPNLLFVGDQYPRAVITHQHEFLKLHYPLPLIVRVVLSTFFC